MNDEIIEDHACQGKKSKRDESYYASSFCYWLPDYVQSSMPSSSGLSWTGGAYGDKLKSMGGAVTGTGKCVKLVACHNNARDKKGNVDKSSHAEVVQRSC